MPKLIIQDQTGAIKPKVKVYEKRQSVNSIIIREFGSLKPSDARVFLNDFELTENDDELLFKPLGDDDRVTVIKEVKGLSAVADGFTGIAKDVLGFVVENLVDIPEFDTQTQGSPNNSFSGQTNVIRLNQQKPVVCGSPVIYPDLIGEAIEYYVDDIKYVEQVFYACHGTLNGFSVRAGETLAVNVGANVETFLPAAGLTTVTGYRVGQKVDEIDGQKITGTNEGAVGQTYNLSQATTNNTYVGTTFTAYVDQDAASDQLKTDFDAGVGDINLNYTAMIEDDEGVPSPTNVYGTGRISSMALNASVYTIVISSFNGPKSQLTLPGGESYIVTSLSTIISSTIGPINNPRQCSKMFFNVVFNQGLKATADIRVTLQELDGKGGSPVGAPEIFDVSYTEDSPNDRVSKTFEINPLGGYKWYRFEVERTNEESQDTQKPDVPTLEKVFCVEELGDTQFKNATMLRVVIRGDQTGKGSSVSNKINLFNGQVEMPSYDLNAGLITANAPSRKCADAILFLVKDFYGLDPTEIMDLDELYTIQANLDAVNPELAQFDYTFDDAKQGMDERISIILNVMRCQYYRDSSKMQFWRDEASIENDSITKRDIVIADDRDYSITRKFFIDGDKDSVQVEYIDRSINKPKYIYRSLSNGAIVNAPGKNPKKIPLTGCQSEVNATNRVELEIRRLMYQRTTGTETCLPTKSLLSRGQVILWDEIFETQGVISGMFKSINDSTVVINSDLDITKSYNLYFNDGFGGLIGPQSITVIDSRTFTASNLVGAYGPATSTLLGSPCYLVEESVSPELWRVIDKDTSGGKVQLTMTNYDARMYELD